MCDTRVCAGGDEMRRGGRESVTCCQLSCMCCFSGVVVVGCDSNNNRHGRTRVLLLRSWWSGGVGRGRNYWLPAQMFRLCVAGLQHRATPTALLAERAPAAAAAVCMHAAAGVCVGWLARERHTACVPSLLSFACSSRQALRHHGWTVGLRERVCSVNSCSSCCPLKLL